MAIDVRNDFEIDIRHSIQNYTLFELMEKKTHETGYRQRQNIVTKDSTCFQVGRDSDAEHIHSNELISHRTL